MSEAVLDASAALALLNDEPGAEAVAALAGRTAMCAVNLAEVVGKLAAAGMPRDDIRLALQLLHVEVVPFDEELALDAGMLLPATRSAGLSLGDRACLALARRLGLPAWTADRVWSGLAVGVEVRLLR